MKTNTTNTVAAAVRLYLHRCGGDLRQAYRIAERALLACDPGDELVCASVCDRLATLQIEDFERKAVRA